MSLLGKFASFFQLKSRRKRKRKILITQESLGGFLQEYDLASSHSLGKSYLCRRKWVVIFSFLRKIFTKIILFASKTTWRLAVTFFIFLFVGGMIPTILGAPQSETITTKAEWDLGQFEGVTSGNSIDSIQLEPAGTWESRIWTPTPDTVGIGSSSALAGNYLYATRGYSTKAFWRYNIEKNLWESLPDLPLPAHTGADLSYVESQNAIFATFGGYSTGVYKYNISGESWSQIDSLPDGVLNGGSLETNGTDLFLLKGNASNDFYRYDKNATSNPWETLSGPSTTVSTGGTMIYDPVGDYMYVARGSNTATFYRYKVSGVGAGTWSVMANIQVGATSYTINGETKGVYWTDGTIRYIYLLRSTGTNTFLRYQISCNDGSDGICAGEKNTWSLVTESSYGAPGTTNSPSLTYNPADGYIYILRGTSTSTTGTQDLWKFNPAGTNDQKWVGVKPIQNTAGALLVANTGADLIYNGNYGGSRKIFSVAPVSAVGNLNSYDPTTNTWSNTGLSNISGTINTDVSGTFDRDHGYIFYPNGTSRNFFRSTNGGAWTTLAPATFPASSGNGTSMAYVHDNSTVYILQGNNTNGFYACDVNLTACASAGTLVIGGVNYVAGVGAKLVSPGTYGSGTELYATLGNGETTFLKYSSGAWSVMADTPFTQYYGVSLTAYNGKIYALAGFYRDETWEYDPSEGALGTWRKLPRNQKYSYGRGPERGASLEYDGDSTLFATTGLGLSDMWKFAVSSNNYLASGTYESQAINLDYVDSGITFSVTQTLPANTATTYESAMSDDGINWDEYAEIELSGSSGTITPRGYHKYIKIKITLESTDASKKYTPTVKDFTISYNSNTSKPANPTNISGSSAETDGTVVASSETDSHPYVHPYFFWSGASNNGSGIAGYYVCFALDGDCADPESAGTFQTGNTYTVNTALKTGVYHLKIKTKDNNGNVSSDVLDAFSYNYSGVSVPAGTEALNVEKTTDVDFSAGDLSGVSVRGSGATASLRLASASGSWNQTRLSLAPVTNINNGGELVLANCKKTGEVGIAEGKKCLYTIGGNNTLPFYRYEIANGSSGDVWSNMQNVPINATAGSALTRGPNNTLYATRGMSATATVNYRAFWNYDIANDAWTPLTNAPRDFNYGSGLLYDGDHYIYALPGTDDTFYRYNTGTGNWTGLANAQFGNSNTSNGQYTGEGSSMVYDGRNNIYVTQGNQFAYFAKYSIASDTTRGEVANKWTSLRPAPVGFYYSGSLTYDSETNAIYAITGNNAAANNSRQYFLKYDIETDSWSNLPDAPAVITGYGGSLENYNGYIYFTRGSGTRNFYRYNIADNSWEMPQRGFFGQSFPIGFASLNYTPFINGTAVVSGEGDNLYLTRGTYDNFFGKYDTKSGEFNAMTNLPVGAYNGAAMIYDEDERSIYYTPGAISTARSYNNNYFFKYSVDDNTWGEIATTPAHPTINSAQTGLGSSMVYDGSRYIYLTRGANTTTWWRYDTCNEQTSCTPGWSANLFSGSVVNWQQSGGAQLVHKNGIIYALRGGGALNFFSCDVAHTTFPAACWTALTSLPAGATVNSGGSLMDGNDGYLYAVIGSNLNAFYRYNIAFPGWEQISSIPANVSTGGAGAFQNYHAWTTAGSLGTDSFTDGLYSYLIGSATNGVGFEKTGSYTSDIMETNMLSVYEWANLEIVYDLPNLGTDFLEVETRSKGLETDDDWSEWQATSNDHVKEGAIGEPDTHTMSINSPVNPYLQVRINFTSADHTLSPLVDSYKVYYYQDLEKPTNPSALTAYDTVDPATRKAITNPSGDSWFNYATPRFEWPSVGEIGGAFDNPNPGGSGIAGYYVYFGEDANGEPIHLQTDNFYTPSAMTSGKTYYLRIQAIDNAGLPADDVFTAFVYNYDSTAPTTPTSMTVIPLTYTAINNFQFNWESDATDATPGSSLEKLQYCTGTCAPDDPAVWYDIADPGAISITIPNADHPEGAYQPAKNTFKLRSVDKAGNYSASISQDYYFSASAPTPPEALNVSPEGVQTENNFTFTWGRPLSFTGDPAKLKYYYSINTEPTAHNVIETTAQSAGPGPFATQFGSNKFYVVAKDESDSIDYKLFAFKEFFAETVAPGPPLNAQAFDTSDRESAEYSVAIKWSTPTSYDAGNFAGYAIFRSEDGIDFGEEIAMTTGSAFVDTNLESKLYYYYVKSKDKTNNYSIPTSTVSVTPTGRYTTPPTLVGTPKVVTQSFAANFTWATNRVASSFVEYGTSSGFGKTNGQVDSLTDHMVDVTGLSAGTKYFYRVKYIDPDGNIGMSDILTFTTLPPPTISEVLITDIVLNEAIVSWETNVSATCTLSYGAGTNKEESGGANHVQRINNLSADSTYTLKISCIDADLNEFSSDEYTFVTPKQPTASDVTVQNEENVDLPTIVVRYLTNVPTTTLIYFKSNEEGSPHTFLTSEKVIEHEARIEGLDPAKEYTLSITGTDDNGINIVSLEQRITTKSDSRPPKVVTNRSLGKVLGRGNNSQANVYIKIETDEETNVKVKYAKGVVTSTLEQTASSEALNTYHLITIPAEPGQVYSYEAECYDAVGNLTKTEITSVVVEKAKASATEVITGTFASRFGWMSNLWAK